MYEASRPARCFGSVSLPITDMPATLARPWPKAVTSTLAAKSSAVREDVVQASSRLQATSAAPLTTTTVLVRQFRTRNWKPEDRNRMAAIVDPLTAGPCQGTSSPMRLGASEAYRLNIPKALNAPRLAIQKW